MKKIVILLMLFTIAIISWMNFSGPLEGVLQNLKQTLPVDNGQKPAEVQAIDLQPEIDLSSGNLINREYRWYYDNRLWSWSIYIHEGHYNYFKNLKRPATNDYSVYVTNPMDDQYIADLVNKFKKDVQKYGYTERETVEFIVSFVQSLQYVPDDLSTGYDEYPKYPLETLVDQGGDCEDTSILLASLLREMGYGVVLIAFQDHMGVGVKGDGNLPGYYWEHQGERYYYVETTGKGWPIGVVPEQYRNSKAMVITLVSRPVLTHSWESGGTVNDYHVKVSVLNEGTAPAYNTKVYAAFDAGNGMVYDQRLTQPVDIMPQTKQVFDIKLNYPINCKTRILVKIISNGVIVDESSSEWRQM